MKKKSILVITLILSFVNWIKAQQNDLDNKYYPEKSKYIKESQSTSKEGQGIKENYAGLPFALFGRGVIAISYEKIFDEKYGIEVGFGKAITKDKIFESIGLSYKDILSNANFDYSEIAKNSDFQSGSLYFSVGARFYFDADPFWQRSVSLSFRKWGYSTKVDDSYAASLRISGNSRIFDYQFNVVNLVFNVRKVYGKISSKSNFFLEYYNGVGYKFYTHQGLVGKDIYNPNSGVTLTIYETTKKSASTITFLVGFSIGIAF